MKDTEHLEDRDLLRVFTAAVANSASGKPSLKIDLREFLHHLEEMDGTEEEKLQLLGIIADVMVPFVEMGFGIHPIQQSCGQDFESAAEPAQADSGMLESKPEERKPE